MIAPIAKEMELYNKMLREAVQSDKEALGMVTKFLLDPAGKQMRPILTILTAVLHGEVNEKSYAAALMYEMLHWTTLVHDDIVDEAYMRRGELTLGALMRSKSAVLIGDYLFSKGLAISARVGNFESIIAATNTIEGLVEGELRQSECASKLTTTSDDYFDIIKYKTAGLLAAVAEAGAASVDAPKEKVATMYRFGELLGIAFQIQDDILDLESSSTGKAKFNDFKERKMTLPLIHAVEQTGEHKAVARHLRKAAIEPKSIDWLLNFVYENKGIEHSREVMNNHHNYAIEILKDYPSSPIRKSLMMYCDFVIGRNK